MPVRPLLGLFVLLVSPLTLLAQPTTAPAPAPATAPTTAPASGYASILIRDIPFVEQKPDFCGEACVEMFLRALHHPWTQDQVYDASGLDPSLGRGCWTDELNLALKRIGFDTGEISCKVDVDRPADLDKQFAALHADLLRGIPSIVLMYFNDHPHAVDHFRLVIGYDSDKDQVIYHEPARQDGADTRMPRALFLKLWPNREGQFLREVVRLRLAPKKLADPPKPQPGFDSAAYVQHIIGLQDKKRIPEGFTVLIQRPFVVLGDEDPAIVRQRADQTVRWAVERLKKDFFSADPADILEIWLFKDDNSYRRNALALFGDRPDTPYGYFSAQNKALVMNIATGGGTLVHEIVHPFMAADFPKCPPWLNEGLGSLYEQSGERNGHIIGYTNWRLAGLQKMIRANQLPTFEKLLALDTAGFYGPGAGLHYAQARYLCFYLQEKDLLTRFYRDFKANQANDPSGYKTLQKVLNEKDMADFQARWEKFVLDLRFQN